MKVDHIGYAVKKTEKAKRSLEALGYTFEPTIEDPDRRIYITFGELDGQRVELVEPRGDDSPVDLYLNKIGPTPYHICYQSEHFEEDIQTLLSNRFKIAVPPAPAIAFQNKRVVFLYSLSIGLIELVEA